MYCYVRDCANGPKSLKKKKDSDLIKFFSPPEDKNLFEKWRRIIPPGENELSPEDKLCDSHFSTSEIIWFTETKLPNGNVRRLLRDVPILRPGTIPSIFPAGKQEKENVTLLGKDKKLTPKPVAKNTSSVPIKEKSATPKSIVKNTNSVVKEKIETPKSNFRIRFKDPIESSGKRHPQRTKRRSTILDDYWTDEELNQVHHPGASRAAAGSAKKRKTESSGLQPVIRLVPLECLMDKTVSTSKTVCSPSVGTQPSTEEIDMELKKIIEIPLLTSLKPKKSMTIRSTKETVQFKPPKKSVSKSKMKIISNADPISHDVVPANPSEGFNEVKTETPDIEEELARMEMDEESEDIKNSDIVVMNPPLGEDDSVIVKSEEEDDGYNVNEMTENTAMNIPEGDEIPTIKSESEEEQPATEVDSNSISEGELAVESQSIPVPEGEAAAASEQASLSPAENSDSILATHEQANEVPEVPAQVEQNKVVDESSAHVNEAEHVEKSTAIETQDSDNANCDKRKEDVEVAKLVEEKGNEEEVLEDKEKKKTIESGIEDETQIPTEPLREEINAEKGQDPLLSPNIIQTEEKDSQDTQQVESERKDDESTMETASIQVQEPEKNESESAMEIEKETLPPENIEETTKPVENEEMPKPVESEVSQAAEEEIKEATEFGKESEAAVAAEEEIKETTEDGKESEVAVVSEGPTPEIVNTIEPSEPESEKNLGKDEEIPNKDESKSDKINPDLPEAGGEADGVKTNEAEKGETGTDIIISDGPSEPDDNVIDVSDSEGVDADKGPTSEADGVIDVDLSEEADQPSTSKDISVEQSSASQKVEPERKDDECTMETEHGDDPGPVQSTGDIVDDDDDDVHLDASPAAGDEGDEAAEKETENESNEKGDSRQADQPIIDEEMDIEAEVARLVSEVEGTGEESPCKGGEHDGGKGDTCDSSQEKEKEPDKESSDKEVGQPQEIVLQDTTNLGGITAAGVQNLFSPETIQEILKQIKLPLTTPVTFRIAPATNTPSSSSSGRGRGRRRGMRGMRGTSRQVVSRASSSTDISNNSIDLFRHLTRTRTVFDFPTFVPDIDDDIQYWKLCQILKESFHELIETRNTKTSIGKLTLRVAINRPKKPKVQQNNGESEADPQ